LEAADKKGETTGGTETVLIVDDNADQREMASEIISNLGYQFDIAENGHRAIEIVSAKEVDIIVLDMIMEPDFDGLDTYREILKIRPDQKALIVSGYSATERVQKVLELGAGGFVKKPYSIEELGKEIRSVLDSVVSEK